MLVVRLFAFFFVSEHPVFGRNSSGDGSHTTGDGAGNEISEIALLYGLLCRYFQTVRLR